MNNLQTHYKWAILLMLFLANSCSTLPMTEEATTTLSPTQAAEVVREIYDNNGGCALPCLWGIIPGKTQIQDIEGKFSQIGTFKDITRPVDHLQIIVFNVSAPADLRGIYNDETWSFHARLDSDVVVGLLAGVTVIEEFSNPSLSEFLTHFGEPEETWFEIIPAQIGKPDYSIALYYPSRGIFVNWRDTVDSVVSETENNIMVMVCPQYMPTEADTLIGSYPPFFYLFSPNEKMPFDEIIVQHLTHEPSFRLLDEANTKDFYDIYLNPNTQVCFPLSYP